MGDTEQVATLSLTLYTLAAIEPLDALAATHQLAEPLVALQIHTIRAACKTGVTGGQIATVRGSKSRHTPLDLVIYVFSAQSMIMRCGDASALPDLPPPSESVDVAGSLVSV